MIFVKKLVRPTKHSGFELPPGESTHVRGVTIVNQNRFSIYIDKMPAYKKKLKKKK